METAKILGIITFAPIVMAALVETWYELKLNKLWKRKASKKF